MNLLLCVLDCRTVEWSVWGRGDELGNGRRRWDLRVDDVLKMNFSVGVNMYSENVT
jgi:hypothetical protein